jgi:hypothetical protein
MSIFRLTQHQVGKDIFLLPNANGCNIALDRFPNTGESNYDDVDDPMHNPDDDTSYVHNDALGLKHDLYALENHDIITGTINYVQVLTRAKSHLYAPAKTANFKVLLDDSACTDTQKSSNFNLVTTYSKYSYVWNTNPYTGVAFTWADINNYQCGVECNSPDIGGIGTILNSTFRPNAAGALTQLNPVGEVNNWECVDDAVSDNHTTYIWEGSTGNGDIDTYNIPNYTTEAGNINSVTIYVNACCFAFCAEAKTKAVLRLGGVNYKSDFKVIGNAGNYTLVSNEWLVSPVDGVTPFTWADINNMEIGLESFTSGNQFRCTQVYMVVNYTEEQGPDIRATQCYMKVNYDDTVHCDLNVPEEISQDYAQNIAMLNHWSGNRSVYGLSRNKDTTVLTGWAVDGKEETETFYFDTYDTGIEWSTNPGNMVDGDIGTNATTSNTGDDQRLLSNTASDTDYGDCSKMITKVEIRAYAWTSDGASSIDLWAIYLGGGGDQYNISSTNPEWSQWFDITTSDEAHFGGMPHSPEVWSWHDVKGLKVQATAVLTGGGSAYCSKIEVRVTYHDDACCHMRCIEELGKQGDPVSSTGLGYSDYDDEYQILSWGWKCISKKPAYYEWLLELERTT